MRTIHLIALGTRGDVAPMLTLATQLRGSGRAVLVHGAGRYVELAARERVPYRAVADPDLFGAVPRGRRVVLAQSGVTYLWLRGRYRRWSRAVWRDLAQVAGRDDVLLCGLGSVALARPTGSPPPHIVRTGHIPASGGQRPPDLPTDRPNVYVGLGSLGVADPALLRRLAGAAASVGCRLVTDSAPSQHADEHLMTLPSSDHRLLFAQVSGVLHHCGAGTAAAGLSCARPTATIPYLGDQFANSRRIHALGAGPRPLHRQLLTARRLRRTLAVLADPPERYRRRARELADRLAAEDGLARTARACEQIADCVVTLD